jgi:hypothetical protein
MVEHWTLPFSCMKQPGPHRMPGRRETLVSHPASRTLN